MKTTAIDLEFGDDTYTFRLAIAQLEEHDEKCQAGPPEVFQRLVEGRWRLADVRETVRLGLIGGGVKPVDALKLTRRYVDARPLNESVPYAMLILAATLDGKETGDAPGKSPAAESVTEADAPVSTSPPSAEMPSSSELAQESLAT